HFDADLEPVNYGGPDFPDEYVMKPKKFPRGVFLATGAGTRCRTDGNMVRCRNFLPEQGAFTIDGEFLSVESYFNGGDGWPWDGILPQPLRGRPDPTPIGFAASRPWRRRGPPARPVQDPVEVVLGEVGMVLTT